MTQKPTILIVDDEERNIRLLKAMLMAKNYNLLGATHGEEALHIVSQTPPDVILLDVMMPRLDGFEVCRQLKGDEKTRTIPVILVTALSEKQHRIKAMEVGADDFISKPVDHTELTVRVKSLLRIKSYQDELFESFREIAAKNARLEKLEKVRDELAHMIIHDLRNPLTAISSCLQLCAMDPQSLPATHQERVELCLHFCQELEGMIQNLLDISKMEEGKMELTREMTDLPNLIGEVLEHFAYRMEERQITLSFSENEGLPLIPVDRSLLKRVIGNLIDNAIRYTPPGADVVLKVEFIPEKEALTLSVRDNGIGIPGEYHERIFDKFEQVKIKQGGNRTGSSGLGLTFCKMATEAHGGRIWVESEGSGKGCTFSILLPLSGDRANL